MSAAPRRIVMLGPPGCGKGTYSRLLSAVMGVPHISVGDALRAEVAAGSPAGCAARTCIDSGEMVSTPIVAEIVRSALAQHPLGWILDGYPRSVEQAELLSKSAKVDRVVAIEMRRDLLVRKVAGRRLCPDCGISWNIEAIDEDGIVMPPMLPSGEHNGTPCGEHCMPKFTRRPDDQPEVFEHRLQQYLDSEEPIIQFYEQVPGLLVHLHIVGGVDTMLPRFREAVGLSALQQK